MWFSRIFYGRVENLDSGDLIVNLAMSLTHCVILGQSFLSSRSQFPHLCNEDSNSSHAILTGLIKMIEELSFWKTEYCTPLDSDSKNWGLQSACSEREGDLAKVAQQISWKVQIRSLTTMHVVPLHPTALYTPTPHKQLKTSRTEA